MPVLAARRLLNRFGVDFTRWPRPGSFESALQQVLERRRIRRILDVGAHVGGYGSTLRTLGFQGRIDSFEPNPQAYRVLSSCTDGASWVAHQVALGAKIGVDTLTVFGNSELSSLHAITDWAAAEWGFDETTRVPVRVTTVDEFVVRERVSPADTLLKVDTQGHDIEVLKGARETLANIAALQLEIPMIPLYEGVPSFAKILDSVLGWGLRPVGFFPVQRDRHEHLIPVEYDGLFIRADLPVNGPEYAI